MHAKNGVRNGERSFLLGGGTDNKVPQHFCVGFSVPIKQESLVASIGAKAHPKT